MTALVTGQARGNSGSHGGHAGIVEPAREFITDIATVAPLWPFATKGQQPQTGTPLGLDPHSGQLACYDPHTAFLHGQQRAAQLGILAANATGKSLLAKKLVTGYAAKGIPVIIPFDTKNEYTALITALGGTTLAVGRDGGINLLDPGETIALATAANTPLPVLVELRARRNQLVATVAGISRRAPLTGWEQTALAAAIELAGPNPVISDLPAVFTNQIQALADVLARPVNRTIDLLEPLALDIAALAGGAIGQALGTKSAQQAWAVNIPLVIDTSAVLMTEPELTAAVIVTCWTAALSAVYLTRQLNNRHPIHAMIFDEIWRATRHFPTLADQIGGLLRMDRNDGIITIILSHSWTDTEQTGGSNILARCAALALGGMQTEEINRVANAGLDLTRSELTEIQANATGGTTNGQAHGGVGRFLIKQGDDPGRLIQTVTTPTEQTLHDTNQQWTQPAT